MSEPIEAFKNAFKIPELKARIIFTLAMLAVYSLGLHVPTPGVDGVKLSEMMSSQGGGIFGFYDMFTGGALSSATVFALGIMPYITASIILSLLIPVVPQLEALQKMGQEGQKKITEYTRYGTIVLCIAQSIAISRFLASFGDEIVPNDGIWFTILCIISFTTGTAFIMWLGEQISEHGIGNGISLIIFAGIISMFPPSVMRMVNMIQLGDINIFQSLILVILFVFVVAGCIAITTGQRRIPVQYPRQVKGRRVSGGQRTYLPLRVNQAGVIPIIFASSILMVPSFLEPYIPDAAAPAFRFFSNPDYLGYDMLYGMMILFFTFFYTAITFNPVETADNMKKYGGVVVGVRPGKATAEYLNKVMTRITLVGGLALTGIALIPSFVYKFIGVKDYMLVQFFGGTSLLILVGVALDTIKQIEQHLTMRHYDGFSGGGGSAGRVRGRRG